MIDKDKDEQIKNLNNSLYNQTKQVSSISRGLVYSIIGTIWVVSYSNGVFIIPNGYLATTLILCFVYAIFDVFHYFCDSCFYHNEMTEVIEDDDLTVNEHIKRTIKQSRKSFLFVLHKFIFMVICSIVFLIGMYSKFA